MGIVTKTGDDGETGLVGGKRTRKSDARLHAYGTVDELNAFLGAVLAGDVPSHLREQLLRLQHLLFRLGADLASPAPVKGMPRIEPRHTREVENWINGLEKTLPALSAFILPGGTRSAAQLHVARTVCRRAERWAVALSEKEELNKQAIVFLNRVSDYLFLAAREVNRAESVVEIRAEY